MRAHVQYATGISHCSDMAAGSFHHEISQAGFDFSFVEPHVLARLRPRQGTQAAASAGNTGRGLLWSTRRAPWAVLQAAQQAWYQRHSLLVHSWYATKSHPVLRAADLHPLLLQGFALLQQLTLSRYATVSTSAVDLAASLQNWCPDLRLYAAASMAAAAGLLTGTPEAGMPSEDLQAVHELPESPEHVRRMLQAQSKVRSLCSEAKLISANAVLCDPLACAF